MEENLIENWINTDEKLKDLIINIKLTKKTLIEKAEIAFEKLSEIYKIPRMPTDIVESIDDDDEFDEIPEQRSLFEEHALIKFLAHKNEDPLRIVLSAAFNLLNNYRVDLFQVAEKKFAKNIPERIGIGIKGEGFNGEVVFLQKGSKSWVELGCKIMRLMD
ncbi:hypothetical protein [Urechidicola croceus]|uniref:Uncharacterized protein n=1 Tax=Urechidicola croceus TaxID=1850246 RepID=A0A1D8P6H8_9FLAO|nr:hypothetical protein [Urechidicola croceus]AOW20175.1 hypothetical protein LPB138_05545 [Urechidicola croceus]